MEDNSKNQSNLNNERRDSNANEKNNGSRVEKDKFFTRIIVMSISFALALPTAGISAILGIILLVLIIKEKKELDGKYGNVEQLKSTIESLENRATNINNRIEKLNKEEDILNSKILVSTYNFSEYDGLTSEDCKNQLALIKQDEKQLVSDDKAVKHGKKSKVVNNNIKQIIRLFNSECDNIISSLSVKNIDNLRKKITSSFESINKIFEVDNISLVNKMLEFKLQELNLVYTYELKKEQEKEIQKAIKEQMIEEEKVRREIEREKLKIAKDQEHCKNELNKLFSFMQKTDSSVEKEIYANKIKELEEKIKELEKEKETVLEREANARAGYVYVISNIGSFGENVYKIGMTRRLEPMDRIKELSSASVPFEFDVHAMIFSDDAPALEATLHKHFEKQSVNRINLKKEFFKVNIDEIESVVKENFNNTVQFVKIPSAKEFRETIEIIESELNK